MKKYYFFFISFCCITTVLLGQNGMTVLEKLQAGEVLEIDWVQQQYLSNSGSVVGDYPLFPDQIKQGEGEMHATLKLELKNSNQLNIWVESIYSLYFHKIHARPFNPRELGGNHANALSYPTIDDTRYFYEEGKEMPDFHKNINKTPIVLDFKKGILNKDWFDGIEGRDKYTGVYFNYYFVEQMIKALMSTNWKEKEIYQLIEQEKGNYQHTVHFFHPNLLPKKTIISGHIENYYESKISLNQFNQKSIIENFLNNTDVKIDSLGKFKIEFSLDRPACLALSHDYNQIRVYIEPGDSLFINIDGNAFYRKTKFSGDNAISNQTLLALYHELRGDTFDIPSIFLVLKKTQLEYLNELQVKHKKERQFLSIKKEQLSPQFYQFLERHIHFHYASSLLAYIRGAYNFRDAFLEPAYLLAVQNTRELFFRLPKFHEYNKALNDYLNVNYLMMQGRYNKAGLKSLKYFDFSKLIYTEPENRFRIGEMALYYNAMYNDDEDYQKLVSTLKNGCNVSSEKKMLDTYLKVSSKNTPNYWSQYFSSGRKTPKWRFLLNPTENISLEDYLGSYLLLHIGLAKNLDAAKLDLQALKNNQESLNILSVVESRDTNLIGQFENEVLYISPNEMQGLKDTFYITNNANYFYLVDPDGQVITNPYHINSFKKLSSVITSLPNPNETKIWQPSPIFWRNLGITALLLLLFAAIYIQRKRTLAKREQQKRQLVELELKGIRAQMNPHFLFNALSSIQNLIRKKEEVAADRYLTQFAGLVRKILRNSEQEFITLEEEMAAIKQYCSLEALRTSFEYEINIAEDIDDFNTYIPGMLLQPLIENAILHGLMPQKGAKNLWINIKSHPQGLACEIIDNGIGIHQAKKQQQRHKAHQKSFGMALIRQRIQLLIGQEGIDFLKIQDRSELNPTTTGTIVNLIIPIEK